MRLTIIPLFAAIVSARQPRFTSPASEGQVLFASPTQLNLRIPENVPLRKTTIANAPITIVERARGLFPIGFRIEDIVVLFATGANESIPAPEHPKQQTP